MQSHPTSQLEITTAQRDIPLPLSWFDAFKYAPKTYLCEGHKQAFLVKISHYFLQFKQQSPYLALKLLEFS